MPSIAANIRRLFLQPKPSYFLSEAGRLFGMRAKELRGWVEAGEVEAIETERGLVLPWAEVVAFGMELWLSGVN